MIHIRFKNLEKSEIAQTAVQNRIEGLIQKFADLNESKIQVTLEMENSPFQAGPDLFRVKLYVSRGRYNGITIQKADANLYVALAEVVDNMLEVLNRYGDRARVKERRLARVLIQELQQFEDEANAGERKIS